MSGRSLRQSTEGQRAAVGAQNAARSKSGSRAPSKKKQNTAPPVAKADAQLQAAVPQAEGHGEQREGAVAVAPSGAMELQLAELQQLVRQQAELAQQQQEEIARLRASPAHSPEPSANPSPQHSPLQAQRSRPAAAAAPAPAPAAAHAEPQSRFARKEPRAQDLREYDGAAGAKLDAWLDELALAGMLYELNARETVLFAASRLRGAALQWWLALGAGERAAIADAATLTAALRARFQPVTAARTAREQLDRLAQGSRGVNDYIADFQRLRTALPGMAEEDALYAFERGLRRELAVELRKQGVATLQEAIALVARVGGLLQATAAGGPHSERRSSVHQMDVDDGDGAASSLDERIQRAVLNAMRERDGGSSGLGAKTQTHQGYTQERRRGGGGGFGPPQIPGVPAHVMEQRRADNLCFRCGSGAHQSRECPNAASASGN
jgi:hypothetical protein